MGYLEPIHLLNGLFAFMETVLEYRMSEVIAKYKIHKKTAKNRGIEFNLSFDEWWGLWKPFYKNRGTEVNNFVMCRKLDKGAYEIGNVTIGTVKDNARTRKVVNFDSVIKDRVEANKGFTLVDTEDDEDGWLPAELKNPFRSSVDYY